MTCLADIQTILLSNAAERAELNLLPPPPTLSANDGRIGRAIAALIERGLVDEVIVTTAEHAWLFKNGQQYGVVINNSGRAALAIEPARAPATKRDQCGEPNSYLEASQANKTNLLLSLLQRRQGATLAELVEATGWQPHSARAALTKIRKKGHGIAKGKRCDVNCYTLAA